MKNPPEELKATNPDRWKICSALAVIVLISIIAYLPVFHNSLLNWDDEGYIKYNPLIQSFNLKEIFSQNVMGNWHPVTILVLAIEYHFFGLIPTGYHAVNLLLHLLNILLVFYTVYLLSDKAAVALVASLLFGIHPLHVESVAWAAELKDLLYTFFFLASYIFYLKYLKELKKNYELRITNYEFGIWNHKYYLLALLLFAFSLLSKAMAASLPLVLILTDYFKGRIINSRDAINRVSIEKLPFFLLAIIIGVVAILAQGSDLHIVTFHKRLVFAAYGFITYLFKLLVPLNLSAFYPYPVNNEVPVNYYFYLLAFLGLAACIIYSHRFSKKIIFGVGFFTITILLVLQLLPAGTAIMADRYSYIPSIGVFYLAGEGFTFLWSKKLNWLAIALLIVATVLFSVKTFARCGVWKDDMTLWNDVILQDKNVEEAYFLRGVAFKNERKNDEAINDFNRAIELKPDDALAYYNRGDVFLDEKRYDEAVNDFNKAIELKPDCVPAYVNRGIFYGMVKRYDQAISDLTKAIELKPDYALAYYNRGLFEFYSGNKVAACADLKKAAGLGDRSAAIAFSRMCR